MFSQSMHHKQEEEKDSFWEKLDEEQKNITDGSDLIIGRDLNSHVGAGNEGLEWVIGNMDMGSGFIKGRALGTLAKRKRRCPAAFNTLQL